MSVYGTFGFSGIAVGIVMGYVLGGVDGMYVGIIVGVQLIWIPVLFPDKFI